MERPNADLGLSRASSCCLFPMDMEIQWPGGKLWGVPAARMSHMPTLLLGMLQDWGNGSEVGTVRALSPFSLIECTVEITVIELEKESLVP